MSFCSNIQRILFPQNYSNVRYFQKKMRFSYYGTSFESVNLNKQNSKQKCFWNF